MNPQVWFPLPALLYFVMLIVCGPFSVQCASKRLADHANGPRCLLQFLRHSLDSMLDEQLDLLASSQFPCYVHVSSVGDSSKTGSSRQRSLYPGLLVLGLEIQTRI